ncbi:hypothetical protein Q5X61_08125 [Acinetobacter baumannii]|nr:hypothetical protein [Acinetobacter baumannii]
MDKFEEDLREILAQSKHKSSGAERFVRASLAENKYPREFLIYFINSECFGDYESENPSYEAWQHQQAKVEELQKYLYCISEWIDENKFEPTETWLTCSVLDVDEFLDVFCIGELSKNPKSCNHESNGVAMLSNPPVFKCKKCGENYKKQALKGGGE